MTNKKTTIHDVARQDQQIRSIVNLNHAASLLKIRKEKLILMAESPMYYHFTVPKANGDMRHIEAPESELKRTQRKLNSFLQAFYFLRQPLASHGYIQHVFGSKVRKSILTNAQAHLGQKYLINIDFSDFFHKIKANSIYSIFKSDHFQMDSMCAHTLSKICTYKGRLPMGAPTSPVLSNLYCLSMDKELESWSESCNLVYTRYVDDMSFSGHIDDADHCIGQIESLIEKYDLEINPSKTKIYGPDQVKSVTGLTLNSSVDLPPEYYECLRTDIQRLASIIEVQTITGMTGSQNIIRAFKKEIIGKINFIRMIEGKNSSEYVDHLDAFQRALEPPVHLMLRWTQFSNYW